MNRHSGPQVIDYNRGSYDPNNTNVHPYYPSQPGHHQTIITHEQHGYGHQQYHNSWQRPNPHWTQEELHGSQHGRKSRFDEYRERGREYKYNFFSMIDEPWNRCCEVGKCGTCPGNECIAKKTPKRDWL